MGEDLEKDDPDLMLPMALIPVTSTPRDPKATLERLASAVKSAGQTYSQFEARDQVSLSGTNRAELIGAMNLMTKVRSTATSLQSKDNASPNGVHVDLDRALDRFYSVEDDGSSTNVSWDGKGQVTSYSHLSADTNTTTLFQEDEASAFCARLGLDSSSGLVFDKASQQATVFRGWTDPSWGTRAVEPFPR